MKENLDLSQQQIEAISFSIYKDIEQYVKNNILNYRIWQHEKILRNLDIKVALELGQIKIIRREVIVWM